MKSEKEKMLAGEYYNALDPVLSQDRLKARLLFKRLNDTGEDEKTEREKILKSLHSSHVFFGNIHTHVEESFLFDYVCL